MDIKRKAILINTDVILYSYDEEETNVKPPPNFRRRLTIVDIIEDFYHSLEGKILYNCKQNESVHNYLSRCKD